MNKPLYIRLKGYYTKAGEVIHGEVNAAVIFPNAKDIGVSRQSIYLEMLKQHIPSSCDV